MTPTLFEETTYCSICGEEATHTSRCDMAFCADCISTYWELKISEGQVSNLKCPHHNCTYLWKADEIFSFVSDDNKEKFIKFTTRNELKRNAYLRFCPRPGCEGYDISLKKRQLICNICTYHYCAYCFEAWHGNGRCKEENDAKLDKWAHSHNVRYCPSCHIRIEKDGGCSHMTCSNCSYDFCWACGLSFSGHECKALLRNQMNFGILVGLASLFAPIILLLYLPVQAFLRLSRGIDRCVSSSSRIFMKIFVALPLALIVLAMSPGLIVIGAVGAGVILPIVILLEKMNQGHRELKGLYCYICLFAFIPGIVFGILILACVIGVAAILPPFGLIKLTYSLAVICCRRRDAQARVILAGFN